MPKPSRAALATLLCASVLWSTAGAAQDLGSRAVGPGDGAPVDVASLTQRADLVVHGFVTGKTATWIGRVIYTQYDVTVQETLKGAARSRVVLAVPGGALGNVQLTVPGAPSLQVGDQVVFFGVPLQGQAAFTPVGTLDGVVPVRPGNGGEAPTVAPRGTPETLDAFLEEVRTLGRRP